MSRTVVFFSVPLLAHAYLGSYSRFMADDFCSAAVAKSRGVLGGTAYWYLNWSGRYSANFLDSLAGYAGPGITPYAAAFVIATWLAVLTLTLRQLLIISRQGAQFCVACLGAAIILFTALDVTPLVAQSLYWGQGMRSLAPPLVLGTACVALTAYSYGPTTPPRSTFGRSMIVGLLALIAGGFSETYVALQTSALAIALVIAVADRGSFRSGGLPLIAVGLVGSAVAMAIIFVAPGNQFRMALFPPPPGVPEMLRIASQGLVEFFQKVSPAGWVTLTGLTAVSFVAGVGVSGGVRETSSSLAVKWAPVWLPPAGLILLLACNVPIAYGASLTLPDRTLIIHSYVLACVLSAWGFLFGRAFRKKAVRIGSRAALKVVTASVLVMFALWSLGSGYRMLRSQPEFQSYAGAWDERDRNIRAAKSAGSAYTVVPQIHNWASLDEIEPDPKIVWLTKCVQDYYGITVMAAYQEAGDDPEAGRRQREIEDEFQAMTPPPGAVPAQLNSVYKAGRGVVRFYQSDQDYQEIKSHYDAELTKRGWTFIGERRVEAFHKYTGGMHALFCKGGTAANLFYTGQDEDRLGYTYSLALNRGLSSGFTWGAEDCKENAKEFPPTS